MSVSQRPLSQDSRRRALTVLYFIKPFPKIKLSVSKLCKRATDALISEQEPSGYKCISWEASKLRSALEGPKGFYQPVYQYARIQTKIKRHLQKSVSGT